MFSWIFIFLNLVSPMQSTQVKEDDQWECRDLLVRAERVVGNLINNLRKSGIKTTYNIKKHFCNSKHKGALLTELKMSYKKKGKKICKSELYFSVYEENPKHQIGRVVHWLLEYHFFDCLEKSR